MKLVDVHAHLESSRFKDDLDEVIEKCKKAGVEFVINSGTSPERNRECLELSKKYDIVKASFGIYPIGNFSKDIDGEIAWIEEHADECVAVGECGLDFDTEGRKASFEKQKVIFEKQIDLAKRLKKSIVIHSRKAETEAIEILEENGMKDEKVVMHCFCGRKSLIKRCVENGWYFSVPPAIKRWDNFKMLVEMVPLGQLLTETDSPYLGPIGGERNDPSNVAVTIGEVARIKELSVEEVSENIFENAKRVFGL